MSDPTIIIVGGGFAGLAAAKALRNTPAEVVVIDRANHHLFQPLLYQVATSVLTPAQIATPIRGILRGQRNASVIMGEVKAVDKGRKRIAFSDPHGHVISRSYDFLILATGASQSYFGHDEFAEYAPSLKSLADAEASRNRILEAFETAEVEDDAARRAALLTFVLVGAGPTGVEMAGALAILVRSTLKSDFRSIDPASAKIVLVDLAPRVLGSFSETLSKAAQLRLEHLGVTVRLGHGVDKIDAEGVVVAGERIASRTVIWTAGVAPSAAGKWLGVETDRSGRVRVKSDLSVPGSPEIFVVGDTASLDRNGRPLPALAQVAIQQGRYAGKLIHKRITGNPAPLPFAYFDKGSMAVVGKGFAVLQTGELEISGILAWFAWVAVHLQFLSTSSLRLAVFLQWAWTYVTGQRGDRLIIEPHVPKTASIQEMQIERALLR